MKIVGKIGSFFNKCRRVWHILRKPSSDEFKATAKISAIGILLIGLIGFIISAVMGFF
jgi:protein transport protein SEC61 subunit gamma-like protein